MEICIFILTDILNTPVRKLLFQLYFFSGMDVKVEQRIWICHGVVEMGVGDLEMVPIQVKLLRIYPT